MAHKTTYLTPKQISERLGICYAKTLDFIKYSGIKYLKIGRLYYVSDDILEKFLSEHTNINTEMILDKAFLSL